MPARTPEEVDALFEQGISAGDAAAVVALYAEDAVLIPQPGQEVSGRAAIEQSLQAMTGGGVKIKMNVVNTITAGDTAVIYNDWTGAFTTAEGATVELSGKAIEVVRRQPDGSWLFAIDDPYARG
jgi:uncharacterized protein (TIGR02246 family)